MDTVVPTPTQSCGMNLEVALAVELPPPKDGAGAPERIPLIPAGELLASDGRRWTHDDAATVLVATRERAGGTDLVMDYEHQTDLASENGQPAPVAGWIRELDARDGALWGRMEWTAWAAAHIAAREYRFISPTFAFDGATRQVKARTARRLPIHRRSTCRRWRKAQEAP